MSESPSVGSSTSILAGMTALGTYVPSKVVTNHDLARIVETSDEWVVTRTGIRERRFTAEDEFSSHMAIHATEDMIVRHGPNVLNGVDLVILATSTPDALLPATAAIVQNHFKLKAGAFDLIAACPGWMYALSAAAAYVKSGMAKKVLTIGSDALSKIINWEDRGTLVLFGDGACAAIVEAVPEGYGFKSFVLGADGEGAKHLNMRCINTTLPDGSPLTEKVSMNGREVFKFAVRVMSSATREAVQQAGMTLDQIAYFVPHQANFRIIDAARSSLELPLDKVVSNVERYGNTSAASVGIAMREALDDGRIKDGDDLLLVSFGAGLSWASSVLRWHVKTF